MRRMREAAARRLRAWRNRGRLFEPVFIAGAMGSGTSVLAVDLLQRFDFAGMAYESALQLPRRSPLRMRPLREFASPAAYADAIEPDPSWSAEAGREDLQRCYRSLASGPGTRILDKGPNTNLVRADFLARCFPDAPFVLMFRDPVVNVEGFRRKWPTFGDFPLAESIGFFETIHERFLGFAQAHPDRVFTLEYETYVARHDEALARLARHVGLAPARHRHAVEERPNVAGLGIRNVRGNEVGIVKDANDAAYRRITPDVVESVRSRLGGLHSRLRAAAAASWAGTSD